jgi:hypothetical protein
MIMCKHRFGEPMVIHELWKSHSSDDEYHGPCDVTLRHSKLQDFRLRRVVNKIFALLGT